MRLLLPTLLIVASCHTSTEEATETASWPVDMMAPPPYVIDSNNSYNDVSRYYVSVSSNWWSSTGVAGYWQTGYWVTSAAWTYDPANFYFYLDTDACLLVESWWTAASDRAQNVPYQGYNASGAGVGVSWNNQQVRGSQWNEVGRWIFTPGWNRVIVSRWADLGTYVVADAIKVSPSTTCPGWCGPDADGDGVGACSDSCDSDPGKTSPGVCGCGVADTNQDGDALLDCQESCDTDPSKTSPGVCGCGVADTNQDGDALLDCQESCDTDPSKTSPGVCGCGVADVDQDGDASLDCQETCDSDPAKTDPGACGCGVPDTDGDGDGAADCVDGCPTSPLKTDPGTCGCAMPDEDIDGDGVADCTLCGDGVRTSPEQCDDGNRVPGDSCDASCQLEELLFSLSPGTAGTLNTLSTDNSKPNKVNYFLASTFLGTQSVPGCPGLVVPLRSPTLIGSNPADGQGTASIPLTVPATLAGRTYALVAVETATCRVSEVWFETF